MEFFFSAQSVYFVVGKYNFVPGKL